MTLRTARSKNRKPSQFATVIELLESRCLLSGAGDLIGDTQFSIDPPPGVIAIDQPPIVGTIDDSSDRDVFEFVAGSSGTVQVRQSSAPVSAGELPFDGVLQVFAEGSDFPFLSDFGTFDTSIPRDLSFAVTAGESYFVDVTGFGGSVGDYLLELVTTTDVGDTVLNADDLGVLATNQRLQAFSAIEQPADVDVFGFQSTIDGSVFIDVFPERSALFPTISLLDASGAELAQIDGYSLVSPIAAGEAYFATVSGAFGSIGDYSLSLSARAVPPPDDFPDDLDDPEVPIFEVNPSTTVTGEITNQFFFFDFDVFQVDAPADSPLRVSTDTPGIFVDVIVQSTDEFFPEFFFVNSSLSQVIPISEDTDVFIRVSSFDDGPYSVALQTVVTEGRHDTFATAARTDDPPGDDAEEITQSGEAFDVVGELETTTDQDFFTFVAPFTGFLTITAPESPEANAENLDFDVAVFEEFFDPFFGLDRYLIAADPGGEFVRSDSGLSVFVFQGGQYYLSVTNSGETTGSYELNLEPVSDGFANSFQTAQPVVENAGNQTVVDDGQLENAFDVDFFRFVAPETGGIRIRLSPGSTDSGQVSPLAAFLDVYSDTSFSSFLTGAFAFNNTGTAEFTVTAGQTYFFAVFNNGFSASAYDVSIKTFEVTDDFPVTQFITDASTISGQIETSGDIDTFQFTASADGVLQFSLEADAGSFLDPVLTVEIAGDDRGPFVNDDFGFSLNSYLSVSVLAGDVVTVSARGFGSSRGRYVLTVSAANTLTPGVVETGSIETAFSSDLYHFTAEDDGTATIAVNSAGVTGLDPIVTVTSFDDLSFFAFDDDSGPGLNSLVTFRVERGRTYDVTVGGYDTTTGGYEATLTFASVTTDDFGDSFNQAQPFVLQNGMFAEQGNISPAGGDVDVFSFQATFSGTLRLTVSPTTADLLAGLSVFEADGTGAFAQNAELIAVADSSNSPDGTAHLSVAVDQGQTYFVRLSGLDRFNANGDSLGFTFGDYTLMVNVVDDQVPPTAATTAVIAIFEGTGGVTSGIDFETDRDWYRLVAPSSGYFTINLESLDQSGNFDPVLTIYDERALGDDTVGQFAIARNDDRVIGETLDSQVRIQTRGAGEVFYVEAAGVLDSTGDYRLSVSFKEDLSVSTDVGNDPSEATPILFPTDGVTVSLGGLLELGQDRDFYSFTATADVSLELAATTGLPDGVELRVFEVESPSLDEVSIDSLVQVGSTSSRDPSQRIEFNVESQRSFLVAVINTGNNNALNYDLRLTASSAKPEDVSELESAEDAALQSLADDAAARGDRDETALRNAIMAAGAKLMATGETFLILVVDPDPTVVLMDSTGRSIGVSGNTGTVNEISGSSISPGVFAQIITVPFTPGEQITLQIAGFGNLNQSFSAFIIGPSGMQPATQTNASTTTRDGGKASFTVQLGFGDTTVIPNPNGIPSGQTPSFFMMTNVMSSDRQAPSPLTNQTIADESPLMRLEDQNRLAQPTDDLFNPIDPAGWRNLLEGVLQELHIEGLNPSSLESLVQRLRANESRLPVEFLKNSPVVRSAKAMYEVLKQSTGWLRNVKPATPAPRPRAAGAKVTQTVPTRKPAQPSQHTSNNVAQLGG
jgi:hypothetical protein